MQLQSSALPPYLTVSTNTVFATSGDVYALKSRDGTVFQRNHISGLVSTAVENEILYLNVNNGLEHKTGALRVSDGTFLWDQRAEGHLVGTPVIVSGVVYVCIVDGKIDALHAHDGSLLWHYIVDIGPDIPSFLGPILLTSATVAGDCVYLAPAVNPPLIPYVYALHAKEGKLLWKAPIVDSTSFPLKIVDDVIYISTHSGCLALHAAGGSPIWHYKVQGTPCSSPIIVDGTVYLTLSKDQKAFLYALRSSDGSLLWQQQLGADSGAHSLTEPAVTINAIYVGTDDGSFMSLAARDGKVLWTRQTGGRLLSSPVIGGEGVYVGANDGCVYAFRASNGIPLWQTCLGVPLTGYSSIRFQ
jgi:outer membrane protein assembly factor BamB